MEVVVECGPAYTKYVFSEQEFKDKLGIEDDRPVLLVSRDLYAHTIEVRMSP